TFPVTGGPDPTQNSGGSDWGAFVVEGKADGSGLVYAGDIGGSADDEGYGIAGDTPGRGYVAGATSSTEATFPVLTGPQRTYLGGSSMGFVAKVRPDGSGLEYAGFVGSGSEFVNRIAVDAGGRAYLTGTDAGAFPVVVGPD